MTPAPFLGRFRRLSARWQDEVGAPRAVGGDRVCAMVRGRSTVLLDGRLDGTARLGEILRHHHWMHRTARLECQEPRFDHRGDL